MESMYIRLVCTSGQDPIKHKLTLSGLRMKVKAKAAANKDEGTETPLSGNTSVETPQSHSSSASSKTMGNKSEVRMKNPHTGTVGYIDPSTINPTEIQVLNDRTP